MTAPTVDVTKRRTKTLAILRDGRCTVAWARPAPSADVLRPTEVRALVKGYMDTYRIRLADGIWTCSCIDGAAGECAHAWAVRLVTGHGSDTPAPSQPEPDLAAFHDGMTEGGSTAWCRTCGDQGTCPDCVNA